jgi:hypothetical protein
MGYQTNYSARTFSKGTKALAFHRANGCCTNCGIPLTTGNIHYDHRIPYAISRHSGPSNCQVLCRNCHATKTATRDVPEISHGHRVELNHIGADGPGLGRHPMPGGRRARQQKKMNGRVVTRSKHAGRHARMLAALSLTASDGTLVGAWAPSAAEE